MSLGDLLKQAKANYNTALSNLVSLSDKLIEEQKDNLIQNGHLGSFFINQNIDKLSVNADSLSVNLKTHIVENFGIECSVSFLLNSEGQQVLNIELRW